MTEPAEVEVRFDVTGKITVLRFTWRGTRMPVTSQGRQWVAEDGRHFLVMTTGERVFELVYESTEGVWRVAKAPGRELSA